MIRILAIPLVAFLIFAATRGIIRALPGDPLETMVAESGTTLPADQLREEFGLDRPFWVALGHDVQKALHGDLGISIITHQPITPVLAHRSMKTLELTLLALVLAIPFSIFLGLLAAEPGNQLGYWADSICTGYGAIVAAMPTPWIGPLLMVIFCVWIPALPTGDHVLLPAVTLAVSFGGFWSRLVRERVREALGNGATRAARARGIPEWRVALKYGLAPVSGALLAYLGTQAGHLMAGAFITEVIFDWRGMGSLLVDAVLKRDYPVVEAATFFAAFFSLIGTAIGDWAQHSVDPRLRSE